MVKARVFLKSMVALALLLSASPIAWPVTLLRGLLPWGLFSIADWLVRAMTFGNVATLMNNLRDGDCLKGFLVGLDRGQP